MNISWLPVVTILVTVFTAFVLPCIVNFLGDRDHRL